VDGCEYRSTLQQLTGVQLGHARLEARFVVYGANCWISPHTDRSDKLLTQTFYFEEHWCAEWGGELQLLRSADVTDIATRILPLRNLSVVLVPSPTSWHAVAPVAPNVAASRRTLLLHYTLPGAE
jgi:Rps23 Pro-64 3,4-dihydroxylase Tpa1-like proline 4-hydroxylase